MFAVSDWTQVWVALITGVPATIAAVGTIYLGRLSLRKIDHNTQLTRVSSTAAQAAAQKASTCAQKTEALKDTVAEKLNGGLDDRIRAIVREHMEPMIALHNEHVEQDDRNMKEIRAALGDLRDRLPK